ncbi:MAG: DUF2782 domain-containing protein [Pseudomonadota bacterium]
MLSAPRNRCTQSAARTPRRYARARRTQRVHPALVLLALLLTSAVTEAAESDEIVRGPDVTIIEGEERTVYEYRQNGQLRMVRVVPRWGKPYYLVPRDQTQGNGDLERADMLLPSWVIAEF